LRGRALVCVLPLLAACAGGPPAPAWQDEARDALERAQQAWLTARPRVEAAETARMRAALAGTGRPELLARAELARCAALKAALALEQGGRCPAFEALAADAAPAERAYADHLAGRPLDGARSALLPAAQLAVARALAAQAAVAEPAALLDGIDAPLARLVAAAVLFEAGRGSPALVARAVDTASEQGWRRALLAWLAVARKLALERGDLAEAARLERRSALVEASLQRGRPAP
jgi:hypothetical protein